MPFETPEDRDEHFGKHRLEFPKVRTAQEYEELGDKLMKDPTSFLLYEGRRPFGGHVRLNVLTNEFAATGKDGFLVTYFVANPAIHGEASNVVYWRKWCV